MMTIISGLSEKDRISFATFNRAITAIRKRDRTIEFVESSKLDMTVDKCDTVGSIVYIILCVIKVYCFIPMIEKEMMEKWCYFIPGFFALLYMIISIFRLRVNIGKEGLKNHGAEHKVFKAYRRLKRIPTLEEAKQFSRISRHCVIARTSGFITVQLIGFILYTCMGYQVSEILLYIVPLFVCNIFPFYLLGNLAQFFTTAKPEEENIELAIAALTELNEREEARERIAKMFSNILRKQ